MPGTSLEELENQIAQIICKITGMEREEIKMNAHLYRELGIDSIKAIELVVAVQEKYNIRVDDSKLEKLTTVELIAKEVKLLLGKR